MHTEKTASLQTTKHKRNLMKQVKKNWKQLIQSILLPPTIDELETYQPWWRWSWYLLVQLTLLDLHQRKIITLDFIIAA